MRVRLAAVLAVSMLLLAVRPPGVQAAAEVHRLNVVASAIPTHVRAGDFNDFIDDINNIALVPGGLEPLGKISLSWLFDGEVRYFARQNLAITVGAGRLSSSQSQEYLPSIEFGITVTAEISAIPIHAGAAYYFTPYNQGDFQARAFVGGGFVSLVESKATVRQDVVSTRGPSVPVGPSVRFSGTGDGPGYYGEVGAHMFFASRFSVLLSALIRSNEVRHLVDETSGLPYVNVFTGQPVALDVGGTGFRMALSYGL